MLTTTVHLTMSSHKYLLSKLENVGTRDSLIQLFKNYLNNRTHVVQIEEKVKIKKLINYNLYVLELQSFDFHEKCCIYFDGLAASVC